MVEKCPARPRSWWSAARQGRVKPRLRPDVRAGRGVRGEMMPSGTKGGGEFRWALLGGAEGGGAHPKDWIPQPCPIVRQIWPVGDRMFPTDRREERCATSRPWGT